MNTWNNNCIGLFLMLKNNMIYIHYKKKLNLSITAISALQKLKSYICPPLMLISSKN